MSIVLALDAATPRTALALGTIDAASGRARLLAGWSEEDGANQASTWLIERIEGLCREAGVGVGELAAIACGQGPGTFTGTRVAVATAKGLALGIGCPCLALSSLAALAGGAPAAPGAILALLDARRGEVYAGVFARVGERVDRIAADRCASIEDVLRNMSDPTCLIGPGVSVSFDKLSPALRGRAQASAGVTPEGLWRAAATVALAGPGIAARELDAVYLRGSYAELGLHQPKRPMIRSPFV